MGESMRKTDRLLDRLLARQEGGTGRISWLVCLQRGLVKIFQYEITHWSVRTYECTSTARCCCMLRAVCDGRMMGVYGMVGWVV